MSKSTHLRALSIAGAVALAVTACSNSTNVGPAAGAAHNKQYTVDFIETNTGNPYNDVLADGFKKAASALGFALTVTGPSEAGASAQLPFIQQAIVKHVDAIVIQPNDPTATLPALQQAKAAGIKIFEVNSDSIPMVRVAAVTALDYSKVPAAQMAELGKEMNYSGDFAILTATTTATFQKTVVDAERHILASDPKYKNMHLVKVAYGNDVPATSTAQTQALLAAFPSLKAITAPTTVALAAAAQTVESANKSKKLIVTGLGDPNEMRKFVKDGTVSEFQLWSPSNMGLACGYLLSSVMKGQNPKPGSSITVPGLGSLTLSSKGVLYSQNDLTTFTASNIDQYQY